MSARVRACATCSTRAGTRWIQCSVLCQDDLPEGAEILAALVEHGEAVQAREILRLPRLAHLTLRNGLRLLTVLEQLGYLSSRPGDAEPLYHITPLGRRVLTHLQDTGWWRPPADDPR